MTSPKPVREPIAVCGAALRLPGGINTTEGLWNALRDERDMRTPVPASRYSVQGFSDGLGRKGSITTRYGYFLDQDLACFDSSRFSLSQEEVQKTDPQQRILLEVVQECLENAGETEYRGRSIGCYVGTFGEDWLQSLSKEQQHSGGYVMGGAADMMLANRVSFENDLRGPSMVIKTGCSASLVALHEACRALQMHDCDGAIVAGSNLILGPTTTAAMTSEGILSPEGSCKSFDSRADGFARGEAVTAVYLQRLERAIQQGLPVRAVITNTGTNSDGHSPSLLQPSAIAQSELMRKVHGDIASDPARTAFVECHGTGTPIGDPLEAQAVGTVFGGKGVYIGSVKPNLGHSEGASGLTSLLKSLVMLEKCMILPNIKFTSPNPRIDFAKNKLRVPTELMPWPRDRDFRVAINSFGIGGSNAHVIMEHPHGYISARMSVKRVYPPPPYLFLLSATTKISLQALETLHRDYGTANPDSLPDLAYTLGCRRERHRHRTFAVSVNNTIPDLVPTMEAPRESPRITMVFSGQGAQWARMGHELLRQNPVFTKAVRDMDRTLRCLRYPPTWSIEAELQKPAQLSQLHRAELSQPLCTALQIALVGTLAEGGVEPSAVVGHSSGEIAAAYAAGAISMEEAITVAYYRGLVTREQNMKGSMAVISLDYKTTATFLKPGVVIACENSPSSTTISGDAEAVEDVLGAVRRTHQDSSCRLLKVDMAYHSHHMKELSVKYKVLLQEKFRSTVPAGRCQKIPFFSSVSNETITAADSFSPEYWAKNLVSPVRFSTAVANALREQSDNVFVEVGPHSTLAGPIRQICSGMGLSRAYCPTMIRPANSNESLLSVFGRLFQLGVDINTKALVPQGTFLTDLPPYPWDHSRSHWYESRLSKAWRLRTFGHHILLGLRVPETTNANPVWRIMLSIEDVPWLADHKVHKDIVFPFAGYVSMVGEAFRQVSDVEAGFSIRNMTVATGMVLDDEKPLEVVTSLHAHPLDHTGSGDHTFGFTVSSHTGSDWIQHCTGQVGSAPTSPAAADVQGPFPRRVSLKPWYGALSQCGIAYGPAFRRVKHLATSTTHMHARGTIESPPGTHPSPFPLHPTIIDASFQVGIAAMTKGLCREIVRPFVPTRVKLLEVWTGMAPLECTASCEAKSGELSTACDDAEGKPCLRLTGMQLKPLGDDVTSLETDMHAAAVLEWVPDHEFLHVPSLVKTPASGARARSVIEEYALLCIADSLDRLENLRPAMPFHVKYRMWLQRIVDEAMDGEHPVLRDKTALATLKAKDRQRELERLSTEAFSLSTVAPFAAGIKRVHDNIEAIFSGQMDLLELLTQDSTLASIYDTVSFDYGEYISALSDSVPTLRILEVGAGTGATTELILRGMQHPGQHPRYGKYTFSDISAGFFPKARERFSGAPNMDFTVFDASRDPTDQGFEAGSYDLIVAANVVHATADLVRTLTNLFQLLAPGGRLMLAEFTTQFHAPNYIFGLFSGWWLGEADGREWEPYVSATRWKRELRAAGFAETVDIILDADEPWHYCATIIARRPLNGNDLTKDVSIVCKDTEDLMNQGVLDQVRKLGLSVRIVAPADVPFIQGGDCIVTFDLEEDHADDVNHGRFRLFQDLCRSLGTHRLLWLMPPTQLKCTDPRAGQSLGMIRTARSELGLSMTTLEINPDEPEFARLICDVFQKTKRREIGQLAPDREYAVENGIVNIGRYRPLRVHDLMLYGSSAIALAPGSSVSKVQSMNLDPSATYMLTGGLGGLGRAIAVWLAEHGARHLVFLSPRAGTKSEDHELFVELNSMGCSALAVQGFAQREADVRKCTEAAQTPIKGVLHLAMQLRDTSILDMRYGDWMTVVAPKVDGARNLHNVLGPSLDFFVMMSSLSTVLYQPGQSNYNAANTFLEAFCQYRHSLGLPASVVNVSPIEGIGYVAKNKETQRTLRAQGHWFLNERELLHVLKLAVLCSRPWEVHIGESGSRRGWVNDGHIVMGLRSEKDLDDESNRVTWRRDRRMGSYHNVRKPKPLSGPGKSAELKAFLARVRDQPEVLEELHSKQFLAMEIGKKLLAFTMREQEGEIDLSRSLSQLGLDSLMTIELQRWWKAVSGVELSVLEMMNSGTFADLGETVAAALSKSLAR